MTPQQMPRVCCGVCEWVGEAGPSMRTFVLGTACFLALCPMYTSITFKPVHLHNVLLAVGRCMHNTTACLCQGCSCREGERGVYHCLPDLRSEQLCCTPDTLWQFLWSCRTCSLFIHTPTVCGAKELRQWLCTVQLALQYWGVH